MPTKKGKTKQKNLFIPLLLLSFLVACLILSIKAIQSPKNFGTQAATSTSENKFVHGDFIIQFNGDPQNQSTLRKSTGYNDMTLKHLGGDFYLVSIRSRLAKRSNVDKLKQHNSFGSRISSLKTIKTKIPNYLVEGTASFNDPLFSKQHSLKTINFPQAVDLVDQSTSSRNTVIAVIDSGVNYKHPDLANRIWINKSEIPNNKIDDDKNGYVDDYRGVDFVNNDGDPLDDFGHGTHVAGTIAAETNNRLGIVGLCSKCKIMPIKVINKSNKGEFANVIRAVYYAIQQKGIESMVLNLSLGANSVPTELEKPFTDAYNKGIVSVAAAGNGNTDIPFYPAAYKTVLAVASIDPNMFKSPFSNYGTWIDISAPGNEILSASLVSIGMYGGYYNTMSGTSMATPHVSGVIGFVLSNTNFSSDPNRLISLIKNSAQPIVYHPAYVGKMGAGIIDIHKAVKTILPNTPTCVPTSGGGLKPDIYCPPLVDI